MPTFAQVRTAIVATMSGVPGVGRVHGFERYAKREADFRALFAQPSGDVDEIRGWVLRRISTRESGPVPFT